MQHVLTAAGTNIVRLFAYDPPDQHPPEPLPSPDGLRYDVQSLTLKKVRDKISEAAAQLKNIRGYPLVVVLADPLHAPLPLEPALMARALYGGLAQPPRLPAR